MTTITPAKPATFLTFHVLRTQTPGNVNRDDLGDPKTCTFGGTQRLRISSQCIKRAIRTGPVFERLASVLHSRFQAARMVRTRGLKDEANRIFIEEGLMPEIASAASLALMRCMRAEKEHDDDAKKAAKKKKEERGETQILALSPAEIRRIAEIIKEKFATNSPSDVEAGLASALKEALHGKKGGTPLAGLMTPEVALFGRMMAVSDVFKSVESPLQVAHALTTSEVEMDRDYWTAVDDMGEAQDKSGAGMIDVRKFGAGVFYYFANLNLTALFENLSAAFPECADDELREMAVLLVMAFADAFAMEQPSGYQTSFAALSAPDVVAFGLGEGQPVNAGAAFEPRLRQGGDDGEGTLAASLRALENWVSDKRTNYGDRLVLPDIDAGVAYGARLADLENRVSAVFGALSRQQ